MLTNPSIFLETLIVTAIVSVATIYLLIRKREAPGALYFAILMAAIFIWIIGFIIELYADRLSIKFLGLQIQYILGISFAPSLWFLAALNYVTKGKHPNKTEFFLVTLIPFLTMILMITTNFHHLYYYNFRIVLISNYKFLFKDLGIWFYFHIVYAYAALTAGTLILIFSLRKSKHLFKAQAAYILIGVFLPWIASVAYVTGMKSYMPLDFTPTSFTFSVALIGWAIYRHGLFEIIPAARDSVIESMRSGVLILDEKGRIVDVNPAAYNIFNRRNVLGTHISHLLEEFNLSLEELRKDPSARKEVHIGNDIYDLMITEVRRDNKIVAGEILNFFNITALKRTEKELSELNTTKDKFFSIIAHDLKNPFYGIMGLSEILASDDEEIDDEEKKMLANEIKELATNTYRMLDNLLDWSRSQTGRLEFNPHNIDISALIAENFSHLKKSAAVKKISLTSEVPSPTAVFADSNMLNTIFRNLISNAIKFTQPGGEISVSRRFLNNSVIISVTDNGVGMNQKTLDQIFRLDKSIQSVGTAGEKGTGLGMVLCKEFIERNGGKIWVESEPGKGSAVHFSLPPQHI